MNVSSRLPEPEPAPTPAFDIDPHVVFRLGDELITDELQALVELVKNSYDASATDTTVVIDTRAPAPGLSIPPELATDDLVRNGGRSDSVGNAAQETRPAESPPAGSRSYGAVGWLEVKDDGDGMTREGLERGWLLISTPEKRKMKNRGETNRLGRTPLGDKGLGRLGVLKLGLRIEIRTRPRGAAEEHVLRFSRSDFQREETLSAIHPHYEQRKLKKVGGEWTVETPFDDDVACSQIDGRQGTVIRVTGLINPPVWQHRVEVQREMLTLISPFEAIDRFALSVFIDDPGGADPLPLGELAELRRSLATMRWTFVFDGAALTATGRLKLRGFEPSKNNEELTRLWEQLVEPDGGDVYRRRLIEGGLSGVAPRPLAAPWWLEVTLSTRLSDVPRPSTSRRPRSNEEQGVEWATPGPFRGELDNFDLARDADLSVGNREVFQAFEPYRAWVRDVRGVKVYRDGFGVRVGDDFLKLGTGFTGASSFYALRPGNVVGFLALSARQNAQLQETTDREGFVANAPYRALEALLQWLVSRINFVLAQVGRELRTWADDVTLPAEREPSKRAAELAAQVAQRAARTDETLSAVQTVEKTLRDLSDGPALLTPGQTKEAQQASEVLTRLRVLLEEWDTLREDLEALAKSSREVEAERSELRDQLRVAYQTVGLGIVAEMAAHEMSNVTARLQATANALAPQFKGEVHRPARALLSEVKSTVRAIRLQLRHLDPQLRYQRARREIISMRELADEVARYHAGRFGLDGVAVKVRGSDFKVRANRGRLQQALDNLFINSEFWLQHAHTLKPRIDLVLDAPRLEVRDNGPGVDPALEPAIFEPFVSGRSGDEGRGLGLFITRQVLRDDNGTIYLGPGESDGRKRSFVIDLSGAVPEPE